VATAVWPSDSPHHSPPLGLQVLRS
jgi:hypothetical protein